MDCLKNIIGITNTIDDCFSSDFNAESKKSDSGKYMDQLEEFPSLDVFKNVAAAERTTLEKYLLQARENGIQYFKEALYKEMGARYVVKAQSYIGLVGKKESMSTISFGFQYAGLVYEMKRYQGAEVVVKNVLARFQGSGSLPVSVYQCINNGVSYKDLTKIGEFTIDISNSTTLQAITPITLPATDEIGNAYTYLFIYQTPGITALDNKASCGCGNKETVLNNYLTPYGISGDAVTNMLTSNRTDVVNGLLLDIDARCTGGDFICDNYNSNVYIREAITWAILRKSVANAIVALLASDLISRYTMTKREPMAHAVNILNSKFKTSVSWIAENIDVSNNDCFACDPGGNGGPYSTSVQGIAM